ncbi:ABC transporter permease [Amycolatopsis sp. NPDC059027]|uniref:ABC transporter permease n=1 Tax=Amycolatopsis sp. NPDC059027 TaxID=3346709 RepID=UPI003670FE7E
MDALTFLVRRLGATVLLLVIVSFLIYSLLALSPGDPVRMLLGTRPASPELLASIRAEYHLDAPFLTRYGDWLGAVARGDLGRSIQSHEAVTALMGQRLGVTVQLGLFSFVLVLLIGLPAGMLAGTRRGSATDRAVTLAALAGMSAPVFVVGLVLLYVLGLATGLFPIFGAGGAGLDRLWHLTLPAVTLAVAQIAVVTRQTRAAAMGVMAKDFVSFARSRGLPGSRIWRTYALRNSALPVVTSAGMVLAYSLSGTVLVENIFGLPGLGSLLVTSVGTKDIPVVQGLTLVTATVVIVVNLLVDLCYLALDPRVRHAGGVR